MPVYEYRCEQCGVTFEALVRRGRAVTCPDCGSASLSKLLSAATVISGRTATSRGTTCCGRSERCDMPPCSDGAACRRDRTL